MHKLVSLLKTDWVIIGLISVLFFISRFYALSAVPQGLTWDEAAIGYNGYMAITVHRDEWLERMPISFRSFGDYKAPLAIYMTGLATALFGLHVWVLRATFVLADWLVLPAMYWLTKRLWGDTHPWAPILATIMIVLSPWHHHFSRVGFESPVSLALLVTAVCFFVLSFPTEHTSWWSKSINGLKRVLPFNWLFQRPAPTRAVNNWYKNFDAFDVLRATGVLALALALYSYHSAKLAGPIIFFALLFSNRKELFKYWQKNAVIAFIGLVSVYPLLYDSFHLNGLTRINSSVLSTNDSVLDKTQTIITHFFTHLSPEFLLLGDTTTLRHSDGEWGVLLLSSYLFVMVGFCVATVRVIKNESSQKYWLPLIWLIAGLLPAAIGVEVPHPNRAILALPACIWLALLGGQYIWEWCARISVSLAKVVIGTAVVVELFMCMSYLNHYYLVYSVQAGDAFNAGFLEGVAAAVATEKSPDPPAEILISDQYQQAYIYLLFARKTNPYWYQHGAHINYKIVDKINSGDFLRSNAVIVATDKDEYQTELSPIKTIVGPDAQPRVFVYRTAKTNEE